MRRAVVSALAAACLHAAAEEAPKAAPGIPLDHFLRPAEFQNVSFAPNGQRFGALVDRDGRKVLTVVDMATMKGTNHRADRQLDMAAFEWVTDDLLDVTQAPMGVPAFDAYRVPGMISLSGSMRLVGWESLVYLRRVPGTASDLVVGVPNASRGLNLQVVDAATGERKRTLLDDPPGPRIRSWVLDRDLVPRAGTGYNPTTGRTEVWLRADAKAPWSKATEWNPDAERGWYPVGMLADGRLAVLSGRGTGRWALHAYDSVANGPGDMLAGHPLFDIDADDVLHDEAQTVIGVRVEAERPEYHWFDDVRAARQRAVDAALPGRVNRLAEVAGGKVLVHTASDVDPGAYYFYDPAQRTLSEWLRTRPWIVPNRMARMEVFRYATRDGEAQFGYLTRPVGAAGPTPLLVWVHGGPHTRDTWGFDTDVQFFASRGYAVFQPYFRGSSGMGARFESAGYRQHGRRMQDDVTDGVRALVAAKAVDERRVCIGGTSYGGYAALMGVIREPALFRCAIDEAGPTDLVAFVDSPVADYNRLQAGREQDRMDKTLHRMVGDPRDADQRRDLEANSPVRRAADIKAPVLLLYGTDDWRVPLSHGTALRDALAAAGGRMEWKSYAGEGHGIWGRENQRDRLQRIERFLAEHLGRAAD